MKHPLPWKVVDNSPPDPAYPPEAYITLVDANANLIGGGLNEATPQMMTRIVALTEVAVAAQAYMETLGHGDIYQARFNLQEALAALEALP